MLVSFILFVVALALLLPVAVLFIECSAAVLPSRPQAWNSSLPRPRIAVLVPAHNEASGIGATLKTLLPQLTEQDRLVVIADNCTDDTEAVASAAGALALARIDPERRGKGYALAYGLQFIEVNPPEVVVVVDADCIVHEGTIDKIARLADNSGRPVQATYLMAQPANPTPKDALSALAFTIKNLVRLRGCQRLGLPGLLVGTGMALPWSVIRQATLASGNIVEDMQLSIDLAIAGYPTVFCPDALVTGLLPQQEQVAKGQRRRWEHGHLRTLLTQVPRLIRESVAQKRFDLLAIALDLCIPPLSLLVFIWATAFGGALLAAAIWGVSGIAALILAIEGFLVLISILGAWAKFGRADIPLLTLLAVPFYILWKIPLYLAFVVRPETNWIRTERDSKA